MTGKECSKECLMSYYLNFKSSSKKLIFKIMEKTQPKIFHIHIDAQKMPKALDEWAIKELDFVPTDYDGHPEGYDHFEPIRHLTLKVPTKEVFHATWDKLAAKLDEHPEFVGYIEGEFLPIDEYIEFNEYKDIPISFQITRRKLVPENYEDFRQTEIHITMEKTQSHPALMKKLLDSGLYGAFIPKADGEFLVLTIQGFIKDIVPLIDIIRKFLTVSGGAFRCTIKEERAIAHKLCNIDSRELPEIAETIKYFEIEK